MTFVAEAFRYRRSALSVNKAMRARIVAVWADLKEWARGVLGQLLAVEPCDDPTAHLSLRDWADLPPHHPNSAE